MTETGTQDATAAARERPPGRGGLRTALLAVIGVGLLLLGGAAAVALGIGREQSPTADSVDAGFCRDMARHHLQGVQMADLALARTADPMIHSLAFDISSTQTNQVGRMQGWLSLWGLPPTSSAEPMAWMGGMGGDTGSMGSMSMAPGETMGSGSSGTLMPGMATEDELAHLQSLSDTAFDVEFLRLMIRHHQGGLRMAQYAAAHADQAVVRRLAHTIAETQTAETQTMLEMLAQRGGTPLPAP